VALMSKVHSWPTRETDNLRVALVLYKWNTLLIVLVALGLSRQCRQMCDIRTTSDDSAFQFANVSALTEWRDIYRLHYINKFSATCDWQVVVVQVKQN